MKRKAPLYRGPRDICRGRAYGAAVLALAAALAWCGRSASGLPPGTNPRPVHLVRPPARPLSAIARIGRDLFFDARLSGSGAVSCATCHDPTRAYGPPTPAILLRAGVTADRDLARAIPSLRYSDRTPPFAIGPDREDDGAAAISGMPVGATRPRKIAEQPSTPPLVPRGGLFWDGRANSFEEQAVSPLTNPAEMANGGAAVVAAKLQQLGYRARLAAAIGVPLTIAPGQPSVLDEALFAVGRFESEDPSFHPYSSRYDHWLEGRATLTAAELRGLGVFEDPSKGNCAACHLDRPRLDGTPPAFTDWQYEGLGVPRNPRIPANDDPEHFDLGLCGPVRTDLAGSPQWCGMFRTPSLRNVTVRTAYFHNGVYHTLEEVLRFYALRDTNPERVYPSGHGQVQVFDDLPPSLVRNIDTADAPFDRRPAEQPRMSTQDMKDVISFLRTLSDADCAHQD